MKNLTKIFMAVVAGMFAFSCATDTTEDLGVQVGGGEGLTTITISLEESRTQLGEKAGQKYPLYWTAGDKISVNGVKAQAQISTTNPAYATFAVAEADKYELAYPAAPAGQVLFAEKQNHVAAGNTFESGVATMYGLGTIEEGFNLHHLTGVLKIAVTGEAVLSKIQISTIDRAPIAGAFDINYENGKLTATEASKNVIEYSFGEGLQLSTEPQYVHVVVPAGQYDELYVTLYDNADGAMYATVKAGESKPLTPGNVREFKTAIPYAANTQKFVIDSAAKLVAFKAAVEAEGGLAMDAVLTEDIDMTGVEWTAINGENYTHTVVGNGYAIKGLTAPLFATTSASFKGLHLEGVNITTNNAVKLGALACILIQTTAEGAKVENCSVSGTITVNNPELDATDSSLMYGGLVGQVKGTTIIGCENHANIEATGVVATGDANNMYIGGVVGFGNNATIDETIIYTTIQNSKNSGKITIQNSKVKANLTAAGIFGHSSTNKSEYDDGLTINNCENSGAIDFIGTVGADTRLGGIIGYGNSNTTNNATLTTISNNVNSGAITVKEGAKISGTLYLAGVVGHSVKGKLSNLVNNGAITIEDGPDLSATNVGGVISQHSSSGGTFNGATNNGAITISATNSDIVRVGGVASLFVGKTTDVVNNGNITYSGKTSDRAKYPVFIGGVVSQLSYYASLKGATNTGNILSNTGGGSQLSINIGGVVCCSACGNIQNLTNGVDGDNTKGKITYKVSGANSALALIAGVICRATIQSGKSAAYTNCNNYGDIYVDDSDAGDFSFNNGYIGGLASYVCGVGTWTNCHNYGDITLGEKTIVNRAIRAAGLFAAYESTILASGTITGNTSGIVVPVTETETETVEQTVDGCSNSGNISIDGKYAMYRSGAKLSYMGGLVGAIPATAVVTIKNGFVNSGNISVASEYNTNSSGSVCIGGVAGDVLAETLTIDGTIVNSGALSYSSDWDDSGTAHAVYVGGIFGKSVAEITTSTISTGSFAISGDYSTMNVGGIVGNTTKGVTNAQVYCNIEAEGQTSAKIGLIAGVERSESVVASNCQVGGKIVIETVTEEDPNSGVGQTKETPGDITSSNWFKHIYSAEVAEEVATTDGCSLIESAPAI